MDQKKTVPRKQKYVLAEKLTSLDAYPAELQNMNLDSMLMDLPAFHQVVSPGTPGHQVAVIFEDDPLLPGVIIMAENVFRGIISRDTFFQRTGKLFGTEVFLGRPISKMLATVDDSPLILPETTLISLAAKSALSRDHDLIYQPIVIEKEGRSYYIISALMLFLAQSHQLLNLHNQRFYTVESGQDISIKEAIIRFLEHIGTCEGFVLPMFVKRHTIRCDHCGNLVTYSIVDIIRSFTYINQGVIVEENMGTRTYRLYVRHHCDGELWEIPVHHDKNLEYRSQRAARIVESYV